MRLEGSGTCQDIMSSQDMSSRKSGHVKSGQVKLGLGENLIGVRNIYHKNVRSKKFWIQQNFLSLPVLTFSKQCNAYFGIIS